MTSASRCIMILALDTPLPRTHRSLAPTWFTPSLHNQVTMFDDKCKPVYDLGGGPYNTVIWNPFGRFLAIAGFGNLPGASHHCVLFPVCFPCVS